MRTLKFTKQFDYTEGHGKSLTTYTTDGGDKRDGTYEVSDKVADAALAANAATEAGKPAGGGSGGSATSAGTTK